MRKLGIHRTDDEDIKEVFRRYLSSEKAGPWFLIVDNADDMDMLFGNAGMHTGLADYLPQSEHGLVLFTTRSTEVAEAVAGMDIIELGNMDREEAKRLIGEHLRRKELLSDDAAIAALVGELAYLPLAITQAAAYLNRNQISATEYLELLRGTEQEIIGLMSREFHDNARYRGTGNAVATTWVVSFDKIRKSNPTAADLLLFISHIEPKAIPRSILPGIGAEEMTHAIGTLCAYSFLSRRGERAVYDMHSLVHLATRKWGQKHGLTVKAADAMEAMRHVARVFPSDDHANRNVWREYMPHALRMLQGGIGYDIKERYALFFRVGRCLQVDGRTREALDCFERCYFWRKKQFSEDHPDRLASQHALAIAYDANGQVQKAVELLEHVVKVQKMLAEDHPGRLASQHALAGAYDANGPGPKGRRAT